MKSFCGIVKTASKVFFRSGDLFRETGCTDRKKSLHLRLRPNSDVTDEVDDVTAFKYIIIEQVDQNKSSLLLNIIFQNTQTLQLHTKIIETEIIYKSNYNVELEGMGGDNVWSNLKRQDAQALYERIPWLR